MRNADQPRRLRDPVTGQQQRASDELLLRRFPRLSQVRQAGPRHVARKSEVARHDRAFLAHYDGSLHATLELADVSRPIVGMQCVQRVATEPSHWSTDPIASEGD